MSRANPINRATSRCERPSTSTNRLTSAHCCTPSTLPPRAIRYRSREAQGPAGQLRPPLQVAYFSTGADGPVFTRRRQRHRTSRDASTRVCRRGARDRGRGSAPPGRARDPSWANPIFRSSADGARSGRHGVSPMRSRGAGRREVQAIAEVAHDTSPPATHPIVPFRLRPSWRGWRPDRKASSAFWLVPCDAYVGFGSSSS